MACYCIKKLFVFTCNRMALVYTNFVCTYAGNPAPRTAGGQRQTRSFAARFKTNKGASKMKERQHKEMNGTLGRFTRSTAECIYAIGSEGERIVGYWQRPRCAQAPAIKSMTRVQDRFVLEMSGSGCKLYLSA